MPALERQRKGRSVGSDDEEHSNKDGKGGQEFCSFDRIMAEACQTLSLNWLIPRVIYTRRLMLALNHSNPS